MGVNTVADDKAINVIKIRTSDGGIAQLECHDSVTSTALLAKKYANSGYPDRYMVFSRAQTQVGVFGEKLGDGQVARGLFLSCILRPSMFPSQAGLLRVLSVVALTSALDTYAGNPLSIGWVSDVFCSGKKIGGVALEGKLDSYSAYEYVIVTFRLKFSQKNFPPRLCDMVERVFDTQNSAAEFIVAKNIISRFFPLYFGMKNQSKYMDTYNKRLGMIGKKAKLIVKGHKIKCRVNGINTASGALIVDVKKAGLTEVSSPTAIILPKRIRQKKKRTKQS